MSEEIPIWRLYALRLVYLLNFVGLSAQVWPAIINHDGVIDPMKGVAYSFWAALSLLCGLGIRYPLRMLPLLFIQLLYKLIWLVAIYLPLRSAGQSTSLLSSMLIAAVVDVVVIPWPYVVSSYIQTRGDRWKARPSPR